MADTSPTTTQFARTSKTVDFYYEHAKRRIIDSYGNKYTYQQAIELMTLCGNDGKVSPMNEAMRRLIMNAGDMEAVEKDYQESETARLGSKQML